MSHRHVTPASLSFLITHNARLPLDLPTGEFSPQCGFICTLILKEVWVCRRALLQQLFAGAVLETRPLWASRGGVVPPLGPLRQRGAAEARRVGVVT